MTSRAGALFALLGLVAACGGKSTLDSKHESSGGAASTAGGDARDAGGDSSIAGDASDAGGESSSAGTSGDDHCPVAPPENSSPCVGATSACNYTLEDGCTTESFSCSNGIWDRYEYNDTSSYTCADFRDNELGLPRDGQSCACLHMLDCTFNKCDSVGQVHAVCDERSWHVTTAPCTDSRCGDGLCKPGEVCVTSGPSETTYVCKTDPCVAKGETTSCKCAASVCRLPDECHGSGGPPIECFYDL